MKYLRLLGTALVGSLLLLTLNACQSSSNSPTEEPTEEKEEETES